jgi:hypothetical protein
MRAVVSILLALSLSACASSGPAWRDAPHDRWFQRVPEPKLHALPHKTPHSAWWSALLHTSIRPLGEAISPGNHLDNLFEITEPLDVNAFGQVNDSSWYTNRISRGKMTVADVARGPNELEGPAPGMLSVIGGKVEGATPGLVVRDSAGIVFLVKFDPPAFPEMSSSAEVISAKLLWAAGYNVPENYVVTFELSRLSLAKGAVATGEYGKEIALDEAGLFAIISHVNPFRDGTIRAVFSRYLPGTPAGNFEYRGTRASDPNDLVPHERRRSLRGLRTFSAWINNTDTSGENTYDAFMVSHDNPDLGHLVHYILDFGDSLGAAGVRPKVPNQGYESVLDWPMIARGFFGLGIWYPYWLPVIRSPYRSVGIYEADVFEPARWRPEEPNPAFDRSTALDDYWAASILSRFTPDFMAAVVASVKYTEEGAFEWVLRVLVERQYKLMDHAFSRVLALDDADISSAAVLSMRDLELEAGLLMDAASTSYRYSIRWNRDGRSDVELGDGENMLPVVDLAPAIALAQRDADFAEDPFLTVSMWRPKADGELGPKTEVHVRVLGSRSAMLVGVDRQVD